MKMRFLPIFLICFFALSTAFASREDAPSKLENKRATHLSNGETNGVSNSVQQAIKITGKVVDAQGQAIPGVTVSVKGTTTGTITDLDGNYLIQVQNANAVVVFSFIGFKPEQKTVGDQTVINVTMAEESKQLEEIVVVGYGNQKKSDVTGALVNVSSKELTSRPVNNAFEALQGKAAGVDITSAERPGDVGKVYIRGQRSLTASNDPLYVVDGIPTSGIESLNTHDIESIDILKDASATAIYGSRGANGVVIVTTKSGKSGVFKLNYTGTVTLENIIDKAPAMNASDYITWRRWAYYNLKPTTYAPGNAPTEANDKLIFTNSLDDNMTMNNVLSGWSNGTWDGSKVKNTDWTKFVTRTGVTKEHTLSASGGSDKMNAYASFG